ncbi:MAG: hypothetical protein IJ915_07490 [Paludibacteraceae bacterium]|nr:hypothetical protein [Paludibacteraceae bacterium]
MAQTLDDQILTIERALGERMISHALVVVRAWLNELGENNPYEQAFNDIRSRYDALFNEWLTSDDPHREETLDALTGDMYRLVDASYASLRLYRGLSPRLHGFNPDNPQSVIRYFSSCLQFRDEDIEWLKDVLSDANRASIALMAVAALAKNIRECFNESLLLTLIEGINCENEVVAEQCLANVLILLAHNDVRIDFFPKLQEAFVMAVDEMGDDVEQAFQTLCALVRSSKSNWRDHIASGDLKVEDLPEELQDLLELTTGDRQSIEGVMAWIPSSEQEYMDGLIQMLPETWVYDSIIRESPEREAQIAVVYLSIGRMDLIWKHIDAASAWLLHQLRQGSESPKDYINYAHCMLLQGDRMMAFEYYRQARQMCKGPKEFFALFRPDRRALVDHGVPIEQVYLIEDQLLNN